MRIGSSQKIMSLTYLIFLSLFCLNATAQNHCQKTYSVGWDEWPPYQMQQDNKIVGIDIAAIERIFRKVGCAYDLKRLTWFEQLQQLKSGKLDFALAASQTAKRAQYAYFSKAYRQETMAMFVLSRNTRIPKIESLQQIIGNAFVLGSVHGYYYGPEYEKLLQQPEFKTYLRQVKTPKENLKQLVRRQVTAILADPNVLDSLRPELRIPANALKVYPLPIHQADIHLMASKKTVGYDLIRKIDRVISHHSHS